MEKVLEICVDSLESAREAALGGGDRLELCANLVIGGTTPSPALVRLVKAETGLPVHAMVRPRFGDFCYTPAEVEVMRADAQALLDAGAEALVTGFLTPEGALDQEKMAYFVDIAHSRGKKCTLHRAFDLCRDPLEALLAAQALGVDTILTSGQAADCLGGLPVSAELLARRGKVEILIGAGVSAAAIREIRRRLPAAGAFHMSGKVTLDSPMAYRRPGVPMGLPGISEYEVYRTSAEKVRQAKKALWEELP